MPSTTAVGIHARGPGGLLEGTWQPATPGAPVVLMIPGSGPTDRDCNNPGGVAAGTYRLLAEGLAASGIASLRVDKRGMYGSRRAAADPNAVTLDDYVNDAQAWLAEIRRRDPAAPVWLLGHSEGGLVALAAAGTAPDLAGLVPRLLAHPPAQGTILEPDDGNAGGYTWRDLAATAEARLGRPVRTMRLPRPPLALIAWAAEGYGRYAARAPVLSRGKVAELYHRDWVSDTRAVDAAVGWAPRVGFGDGLVATLAWYQQAGWL